MAERIGSRAAAKLAGVAPSTWRGYVAREQAPPPDGREDVSGTPWWWDTTVLDWMSARPGRGNWRTR